MVYFIPLSLALNFYIIVYGSKRNEGDMLIRSYYTTEVCIQFTWVLLVISEVKTWSRKKKGWMKEILFECKFE